MATKATKKKAKKRTGTTGTTKNEAHSPRPWDPEHMARLIEEALGNAIPDITHTPVVCRECLAANRGFHVILNPNRKCLACKQASLFWNETFLSEKARLSQQISDMTAEVERMAHEISSRDETIKLACRIMNSAIAYIQKDHSVMPFNAAIRLDRVLNLLGVSSFTREEVDPDYKVPGDF